MVFTCISRVSDNRVRGLGDASLHVVSFFPLIRRRFVIEISWRLRVRSWDACLWSIERKLVLWLEGLKFLSGAASKDLLRKFSRSVMRAGSFACFIDQHQMHKFHHHQSRSYLKLARKGLTWHSLGSRPIYTSKSKCKRFHVRTTAL